jgi:outer membrane protein assembly factor BamB
LKWKYQTGSLIDSPAGIADGIVYFGSYDNNLHSLDGNTGGLKWKFQTGSIVYSSPAGVAYFGSGDGNIYAVGDEPVTGSIGVSSNPLGAQI